MGVIKGHTLSEDYSSSNPRILLSGTWTLKVISVLRSILQDALQGTVVLVLVIIVCIIVMALKPIRSQQ